MEEVMLLTAQMQLLGYILHYEDALLDDSDATFELYYDRLDRKRSELLEMELKKRMTSNQEAWDSFVEN